MRHDPASAALGVVRGFFPGRFCVLGAAAGGRGLLQTTRLAGKGRGTGRLRNRESEAQEKDQSLSEELHVDD